MRSMVKEEKLNSAQYSWLQLKLTHPERVRLHTMRRWHLPYLPIPPDCTPVRHSVTRQYYRLLSAKEAAALGFSYRSVRREKGIHLIISNLK